MSPRIITHDTAADFLQAVVQADGDNSRTNKAVGPVWTLWSKGGALVAPKDARATPDATCVVLVTVWEGERLQLIFARLGKKKSDLVSPLPASAHASLAPLLHLLAEHHLSLAPCAADPLLLRSVLGPAALVDPFMKHWPATVAAPREGDYIANQHLRPMTLTSAELVTQVPLPNGHSVSRVTEADLSPEDLTSLCDSLHKFRNWNESPSTPSDRSRLLPELLTMLQEHAVFIYRVDGGSIAAFVDVARPTTRTVAIRGVYTRGEHRGQGMAERAVREVGRAYLAARVPVYDFKSRAPEYEEKETKWGGRGEVTLFVAEENPGAVKAYRRAGYVMGEEVWADRSLEGVEPGEW